MNDMNYFLKLNFFTLLSFFLTFYSLKILSPKFRDFLIDKPNIRSSHQITKPTGGGITFVISIIIISLFFNNLIPLLCLPISLIGFLDDRYNLPASFRYLVQFATAAILVDTLPLSDELLSQFNPFISSCLIIILIIAATGIINFINFMDGLDGLVTGCLLLIFLTYAILYELDMLVVVGSLFAFLIWNWDPAKIFMGDVGSTFLGALFIGLTLNSNSYSDSFSMLIIGTPILIDPLICIFRRFFNSQNIFKPHKLHLYQRLNQAGWSHSKVTLLYMLMTLILCLTLIFWGIKISILFAFLELFIGLYLDQKIAKPFKYFRI